MNNAQQTAALIATAFIRSRQHRVRLSFKSFQRLAAKSIITAAFTVEVMQCAAEYGVVMVEINTGGFGLMYANALIGARSMPAANFLTEEEIDSPDMAALHKELSYGPSTDED